MNSACMIIYVYICLICFWEWFILSSLVSLPLSHSQSGGQKEVQFHFISIWASLGGPFSTNRGLEAWGQNCGTKLVLFYQLTSGYCRKRGNGTMCYPHTCEARRDSVSAVEVQRFSKTWSPVQFVKSINKKIYSNGLHISRKLVRVTRKAKSKGRVQINKLKKFMKVDKRQEIFKFIGKGVRFDLECRFRWCRKVLKVVKLTRYSLNPTTPVLVIFFSRESDSTIIDTNSSVRYQKPL